MLILGHRGASAIAPENTVAALRAAVQTGAAGSEFDVRMTADGVCVCTHDAVLAFEGAQRLVCDVTLEQLAGSLAAPVATLADALGALQGHLAVAEIKSNPWDACYDPEHALAEAVVRAVPVGSVVACFDPAALERARALRSEVATAVITGAAFDPEANLEAAISGGHDVCSVEHVAVQQGFVERAHARGKLVYAWATDEPAEVRRLAACGVDALMCDHPARALAALEAC